jgi:methionine-rich copper-binding protein CopC
MRRIAAIAIAVTALILSVPAASSHSTIAAQSPAAGETVQALPQIVSITFSEEPLTLGENDINFIKVYDPAGQLISAPLTNLEERTLTVNLDGAANLEGTYKVNYRITSADTHVLNESYEFYLGAPGLVTAAPTEPTTVISEEEGFLSTLSYPILLVTGAIAISALWAFRKRLRRS